MDLRDCQTLARAVALRFNDDGEPFRGLARLLEECGEVSAEVARLQQTGSKGFYGDAGDRERLADELADVLINLAGLANTYDVKLDAAMERKRQRFIEEHGENELEASAVRPDPSSSHRRVTVYCSASDRVDAVYRDTAAELGQLLGERGHTLIYGGGSLGLMGLVSQNARKAGGTVHGVILDRLLPIGGDNSHVHELRTVSTMRSRKRGLEESADVFVTLPGGFGTFEELLEVISFKTLSLHHRPIIIVNAAGYYDALLAQFERCYQDHFAHNPQQRSDPLYQVALTAQEAIALIEA
ncbi:MAG: TIGR00730 family Rossman fold protein [Myxococcota bacterium]